MFLLIFQYLDMVPLRKFLRQENPIHHLQNVSIVFWKICFPRWYKKIRNVICFFILFFILMHRNQINEILSSKKRVLDNSVLALSKNLKKSNSDFRLKRASRDNFIITGYSFRQPVPVLRIYFLLNFVRSFSSRSCGLKLKKIKQKNYIPFWDIHIDSHLPKNTIL